MKLFENFEKPWIWAEETINISTYRCGFFKMTIAGRSLKRIVLIYLKLWRILKQNIKIKQGLYCVFQITIKRETLLKVDDIEKFLLFGQSTFAHSSIFPESPFLVKFIASNNFDRLFSLRWDTALNSYRRIKKTLNKYEYEYL